MTFFNESLLRSKASGQDQEVNMCVFGGGSSAPVTDPQAEAAQAAQLKKEQEEKAALKKQQTAQAVTRATPLVSTTPITQMATSPEPESDVIKQRKESTVLQRRRMRRGRRSLITGSGGGIGYYRGNV